MTCELNLGDCGGEGGVSSLGERSIDHVITDPPYEIEAHTKQRRCKRSGGVLSVEPLSFAPIGEVNREAAAHEIARVVRRWVLVFCQAEAVAAWRDALEMAGLVYKRACIWLKRDGQPQLTGDRPGMGYESIVAAHAPVRSRWNGGGKLGVYDVLKNAGHAGEPHQHPTQKPLELMERLIRDFTDPGETILDPFAGSGTTLVAAKRLGRSSIGWEREEKFWRVAMNRIESTREQPSLDLGPRTKATQLKLGGAA